MNINFLIIGQGLAGTVLSHTINKSGQSFKIVDGGIKNSASQAAAGIFNPITGRQMRKTWMAAELFAFLPNFYKSLEEYLDTELIHFMPVLRMFDSQKQVNDWHSQLERPGISDFMKKDLPDYPQNIKAPLGLFATKQSGYLDVPKLISTYRKALLEKQLIREESFQFEKLKFQNEKVIYGDIIADKIIFCEGAKGVGNPYFQYLPLIPNKGEILEVEIKNLNNDNIYNKNGFLMPRKNQNFWVGSTYHRDNSDTNLTETGLKELESKINGITGEEYKKKRTYVGIRPTVKDRRPLIGLHPENEQIGIFNGLGSKGVSLAPFWANIFVEHLINKKELPSEVNITRYNSLF